MPSWKVPSRAHLALRFCAFLALAFAAGCESNSAVSTGPTPIKCGVTLTPGIPLGGSGGTSSVAVTTQPECAWTATAEAAWITGLTPASGQGNGEITFGVGENPAANPRAGEIAVNGNRVRIEQAAAECRFAIDPSDQSLDADGGMSTVNVTAVSGCPWTAASQAAWLTVATGGNGVGNGTVTISVDPNPGPRRSGAAMIAGQAWSVTQAAAAVAPTPCTLAVTPESQSLPVTGGAATPLAISTSSDCAWTASTSERWITLSRQTGTGSGVVPFSLAANPAGPRTGIILINDHPVLVSQTGVPSCSSTISPTAQSFDASGGAGNPIVVNVGTSCGWSTASGASWITITAGSAGVGPGAVQFSVAANTGDARTGIVSVAGHTFTVSQAAATIPEPIPPPPPTTPSPNPPPTCSYAITPNSQSISAAGGAGASIGVTAGGGCLWSAVANAPWIVVTSAGNGSGNGTVTFNVTANTGAARTGTLTVAGQTFTVSQTAGCTYSIGATSQSLPAAGGAGTAIAVTAGANCSWTAVSNATWITITAGANGTGDGLVAFTVAANAGSARTGTLTIAGQTFTITQAAEAIPCTYSIKPTSQSFDRKKQGGSVAVTAPAGCSWTAQVSSGAAWITITAGASGNGNGTVEFELEHNNTDPLRTGTLTIAGQTFTIQQDGR